MVTFSFSFSFFFIFIFSSLIFLQPSLSTPTTLSLTGFDPDISLLGDAAVLDGNHVRLTRPTPSTSGLLLRRRPITFSAPTSLSTEFSFSISPSPGDGLILILVPSDFSAAFPEHHGDFGIPPPVKSYLGVEFDTSKDDTVADPNANHVGIDVGSLVSAAVANASALNLVLNSGEKLTAWIDYEAASKTLEVRLSKSGEPRSEDPIVSHGIDLVNLWGGKPVYVGLSSSNGAESVQVVSVYSWKLSVREVPKSLHSEPADPQKFSEKRKFHALTVLAGVIFGTVCVALVTFVVLFMWVIFFHKRDEEEVPLTKIPSNTADVRYERIDVAVDKHHNHGDGN